MAGKASVIADIPSALSRHSRSPFRRMFSSLSEQNLGEAYIQKALDIEGDIVAARGNKSVFFVSIMIRVSRLSPSKTPSPTALAQGARRQSDAGRAHWSTTALDCPLPDTFV